MGMTKGEMLSRMSSKELSQRISLHNWKVAEQERVNRMTEARRRR